MMTVMETETYTPEQAAECYVLGVKDTLVKVAGLCGQVAGCKGFTLPVRSAFLALGHELLSIAQEFNREADTVLHPKT